MKLTFVSLILMFTQIMTAQQDFQIKQILMDKVNGAGYNLATDGKDLLLTEYGKDKVHAYHLKADSTWEYVQTLSPSDKKANISKYWYYGYDIAMSGNNAIIGASDKGTQNEDGAVYFYHKGNDGLWHEEEIINVPFDTLANTDYYYGGQGLNMYGSTATACQNNGLPRYVHIFKRVSEGNWELTDTILDKDNIAIYNDKSYFTDSLYISGVYKYQNQRVKEYKLMPSGTWVNTDTVDIGITDKDTYFGNDVVVEGNLMAVGAYNYDVESTEGPLKNAGAVFLYERIKGKWSLIQTLTEKTPAQYHYFGASLALKNGMLVVGATGVKDSANVNTGAVYIYRKIAGSWTQTERIAPKTQTAQYAEELYINHSQILVASSAGLYVLQAMKDCNGDKYGTADYNSCGICVNGNTGIDSLASEQQCVTGIVELTLENNLKAAPNPFNEELILNLPIGSEAILVDIHGKKVMTRLVSGKTNTSGLTKGIYFLSIEAPDKTEVQRLIKF